jgi:hypothetical protein
MDTLRYYVRAALFAVATIAFYRGAWGLLDIYLLPSSPLLSAIASCLIGLIFFALYDNALA